jgi:SAM-dependent methyltransferase
MPDKLTEDGVRQECARPSSPATRLVSNTEWKRCGAVDPLWGLASWAGKQRGGSHPWTDNDLYALDKSDWLDCSNRWERYGFDRTSCVELGCGAGRITAHLSKDFERRYALDVTEGMLTYAKKRIRNARFYLTDGIHVPLDNWSVIAAFSCHVLQHLDCPTLIECDKLHMRIAYNT